MGIGEDCVTLEPSSAGHEKRAKKRCPESLGVMRRTIPMLGGHGTTLRGHGGLQLGRGASRNREKGVGKKPWFGTCTVRHPGAENLQVV